MYSSNRWLYICGERNSGTIQCTNSQTEHTLDGLLLAEVSHNELYEADGLQQV